MYTFNPSTQKQRQVDLISEFQVSQAYLVKSCLKTRQLCQSELPFLDPPRPQTPRTLSNSVHSSQGFTSLLWLSQNSLCRPGWPPTLTKGLLDSGILGLKACATMPGFFFFFWNSTFKRGKAPENMLEKISHAANGQSSAENKYKYSM